MEKAVRERVGILEEKTTDAPVYEALISIEHDVPSHDPDDDDTPRTIISTYKVIYCPKTVYANRVVVSREDMLRIDYTTNDLFGIPILKQDVVKEISPIEIRQGKVISPQGMTALLVSELDDLVVQALREIQSPEIQEALCSFIRGYSPR